MGHPAISGVALRLNMVVAIVVGTYGVNRWLQFTTEAPDVELPEWSLKDMPYELGDWHGIDVEMDSIIAEATGAEVIVNRAYRDESGHLISLHTAMFKNPSTGVYHSPLNCYVANGWRKLTENSMEVKVTDDWMIDVSVVTWEKGDEKVMVAYWYQLGRHILYSRFDLGSRVRWEMRGQKQWPVLFKVMLQTPLTRPSDATAAIQSFSEQIGKWLNCPEHQTYLSQWRSEKDV
jgi:EpsI family protein